MTARSFSEICAGILEQQRERNSIGVLGEKSLHAVLKQYLEPNVSCHEIRVGRYVADIVNGDGVIEIQTRNFQSLKGKLACFLPETSVTVVYPVAQVKYLCWIDEETGAVTKRRKSPKTGTPLDAFRELYKIREWLDHPRLRLWFPLLEMEEYRLLNGWGRGGKRGSTRYERIPLALHGMVRVEKTEDYRTLLPGGLPEPFTTADLQKIARLSPDGASKTMNLLFSLGAAERIGKQGNRFLYREISEIG